MLVRITCKRFLFINRLIDLFSLEKCSVFFGPVKSDFFFFFFPPIYYFFGATFVAQLSCRRGPHQHGIARAGTYFLVDLGKSEIVPISLSFAPTNGDPHMARVK